MTLTNRPPDGGAPTVLACRYELGELIGTGGASDVYRGVDRLLGREVAIKVLRRPGAPDEEGPPGSDRDGPQRLRREARAAASMNHPHVVTVHDLGWAEDILFVVMEYLPGLTLAGLLDRDGPLDPPGALVVAEEVCAALAGAHDIGLVHRDVTPNNIIFDGSGRAKLTDFGITSVTGGAKITATGLVVGTPAYMSPEQIEGGPVDGRSDLYSLGCCLYTMLTGQAPFAGPTAVETAYQHLHTRAVPPSTCRPGLPPAVEEVVMTAMARHPEDRYESAQAMARALRAARAEQTRRITEEGTRELTVPVPPVPAVVEVPPGLDDITGPDPGLMRRRVGAAMIVLAVVLLVAAVLLVYHIGHGWPARSADLWPLFRGAA